MSILDRLITLFSAQPQSNSPSAQVIDRVLVGEALVIEDMDLKNVSHIELIIGPRGSAAERAFARTLTTQRRGINGLLAVVAPNVRTQPATVMYNKVTIKNGKQAVQMFGPAQRGVAMAVMDCVAEGIIPENEAENIFICVGVFIDAKADDDRKIQEWNYRATKQALEGAIKREPSVDYLLKNYQASRHPFQAK
jgi:5,6,7,8-tetrahydromethanopterin hydro-lyase